MVTAMQITDISFLKLSNYSPPNHIIDLVIYRDLVKIICQFALVPLNRL